MGTKTVNKIFVNKLAFPIKGGGNCFLKTALTQSRPSIRRGGGGVSAAPKNLQFDILINGCHSSLNRAARLQKFTLKELLWAFRQGAWSTSNLGCLILM